MTATPLPRLHRVAVLHSLAAALGRVNTGQDRKSTRLNSSHGYIPYAVFCLIKIIVVIGIVALMLAIIIPYFIVNHRKAEAGRELRDLKALDSAVQRYAMQTDKSPGGTPSFV